MESLHHEPPSKSYRAIKLRRKIKGIILKQQNEDLSVDYLLEKEGDVRDFLKPSNNYSDCEFTQQSLSRSYIGGLSQLHQARKDSQGQGKKTIVIKKKKLESEIDPQQTFRNMLEKINVLRARSQAADEKKVSKWNKVELKETQAIKSFQAMSKYWKGLENSIASKSNKKAKELLYAKQKVLNNRKVAVGKYYDKEQISEKYSWYIGLREEGSKSKVEVILPVCNKVTGNFTRVNVCRSPQGYEDSGYFDESFNEKVIDEDDLRELQIVGIQKLPLEVEAVKRVGPQYLKPMTFDNPAEEEIIAEQYDPWVKARLCS